MWWLRRKKKTRIPDNSSSPAISEEKITPVGLTTSDPQTEECYPISKGEAMPKAAATTIAADPQDNKKEEEKGPEALPAELPRPLIEPRNPEVREMVYRQLKEARKVARYMVSTEDLVEEKIRKAMERGEFSNLEGKGRPLNLEERPFEDPTMRIPFKILKDAGFAPYWIELSKEIDAEIAGSRMLFDKFLEGLAWRKARKGYIELTPELEQRRQEVIATCCQKIENANKKIDLYNCIVPIYWMQRKKVDMQQELAIMKKKWEDMVRH